MKKTIFRLGFIIAITLVVSSVGCLFAYPSDLGFFIRGMWICQVLGCYWLFSLVWVQGGFGLFISQSVMISAWVILARSSLHWFWVFLVTLILAIPNAVLGWVVLVAGQQ